MGNNININEKKDTIIWIDANIYNSENKNTYQMYLAKLQKFNFLRFSNVESVIKFISQNKYFEYRLTYVIVSGRLAEHFFNEYVKISEEKNIVIATSVYCYKQKYHETKPYFKDAFLNSGKITFIFDDIIEYILKDECGWGKIERIPYKPEKESYGNIFTNIDSNKFYELTLPILIGKLINSSLLEKDDIPNFQKLLLKRYFSKKNNSINYLIKPSGNKNMEIPHHLLTKYFLKLYTLENPGFYRDLNKDLSNGKFDDYHTFIFLLYNALNKGTLKSYKDSTLYRGSALSKSEFEEMKKNFEEIKNNSSLKALYYAKNFLSFSKLKSKAFEFLNIAAFSGNNDCIYILFIIKKPKNKNFFLTNIDIESFSSIKEEREVLFLPLSCFEIINISSKKKYDSFEYIEVTIKYLEDYEESINSQIEGIRNNEEAINDFFEKSLNSKYGKHVQEYYDKKDKLNIKYCKILGASPNNNFFLNKIGTGFIHKLNKLINKDSNEAQMHIDDEIPNMINEKNKIKQFFTNLLKKIDNKQFDQSYSIGICLGNFIYNWNFFSKAPKYYKAINLATLSLAVGLPAIKLIPKIKSIIKQKVFDLSSTSINVSTILNGLNILYAVTFEFFSIYSFSCEHKTKITRKYGLKRAMKLAIGVGCSFLGNVLGKFAIWGIRVIFGVTLGPLSTFVIGTMGGAAAGYLGAKIGDKLSDKVFGNDEFVLTSSHLYYKYIPLKYRKKYFNPNLKWNKSYLCNNVKSYIIECIVNETDIEMLVINIPKDVFEIDECLGYDNNKDNTIDDDNKSESTQFSESNEEKVTAIFKDNKFVGDLVIPYQGIVENCCGIHFIIYGINEEKIDSKDWPESKKNEKTIEIVFDLSVY